MKSAIKHGSLINMKWLWKNGCSIEDSTIFDCAVYYGSRLRTLKWLLENKCRVHTDGKGLAIETFSSFEKLLQLLEVDPSIVVYVLAISWTNRWNGKSISGIKWTLIRLWKIIHLDEDFLDNFDIVPRHANNHSFELIIPPSITNNRFEYPF